MRLTKIKIRNFRSITDSGEINIEALQAFVGENNAGKSNILKAISCFLTPAAGGMKIDDFKNIESETVIECEFTGLSESEKKKLKPYLLKDKVILQKKLWIETDESRGKSTVKSEYHGYKAEPKDEYLSINKILAKHGNRPNWSEIAESAGFIEHVRDETGRVNKSTYTKGVEDYLRDHDVEYDEPELGITHALGIPQNLLNNLPKFYLLPAITDYSNEIDRRSSSTVFRRLMSDLADRVMKSDPRYKELEEALDKVRSLLNKSPEEGTPDRLQSLTDVEDALRDLIKKLMPSVESVHLDVEVEASQDIFSKGVNISLDDGKLTGVLEKGHGMQRSLVFSLLQMLINTTRSSDDESEIQPIILAIEEPELYIHPHSQRLIFRVLKEFAGLAEDEAPTGSDQVIYSTHATSFVEVWNYERIALVKKENIAAGTIIKQTPAGTILGKDDRKTFKILTCFGLKHNEVFFGREAIIVEGPEDEVAIIATARKIGLIKELPDELGLTILVSGGKGEIPKFQKIMNAFEIPYGVFFEMDGNDEDHNQNAPIIADLGKGRLAKIPNTLEDMIGLGRHFYDQREAKIYFSNPDNITEKLIKAINTILPVP